MIPENKITQWHKCYDEGWQNIIVPEAFSHPAKMSYGLLSRILSHAQEQGWLSPQSIILDCFGGISTTGILAAYKGYQTITVELELKFVELAKQCCKLHQNVWNKLGCPEPVIIQGDSRQLCQIVEKADCIVSSPPFQGMSVVSHDQAALPSFKKDNPENRVRGKIKRDNRHQKDYGQTPGQLGAMKPGKVDMVVSSPPFSTGDTASAQSMVNRQDKSAKWVKENCGSACTKGYGQTSGNLGNLKSGDVDAIISSPPYQEQIIRKRDIGKSNQGATGGKHCFDEYGKTKENLGNLKSGDIDCVISSPPYEGIEVASGHSKQADIQDRKQRRKDKTWEGYNKSNPDNLGSITDNTFWSAARIIVEQCHQILKPGGHAIWVVKSFVRKKKIVDFPGDWQRLCESVGFKTVCIHHAMLVKETKHETLFGHMEVKRKERKSFFRRLAESKGSPRIDFEVVLCMQKSSK